MNILIQNELEPTTTLVYYAQDAIWRSNSLQPSSLFDCVVIQTHPATTVSALIQTLTTCYDDRHAQNAQAQMFALGRLDENCLNIETQKPKAFTIVNIAGAELLRAFEEVLKVMPFAAHVVTATSPDEDLIIDTAIALAHLQQVDATPHQVVISRGLQRAAQSGAVAGDPKVPRFQQYSQQRIALYHADSIFPLAPAFDLCRIEKRQIAPALDQVVAGVMGSQQVHLLFAPPLVFVADRRLPDPKKVEPGPVFKVLSVAQLRGCELSGDSLRLNQVAQLNFAFNSLEVKVPEPEKLNRYRFRLGAACADQAKVAIQKQAELYTTFRLMTTQLADGLCCHLGGFRGLRASLAINNFEASLRTRVDFTTEIKFDKMYSCDYKLICGELATLLCFEKGGEIIDYVLCSATQEQKGDVSDDLKQKLLMVLAKRAAELLGMTAFQNFIDALVVQTDKIDASNLNAYQIEHLARLGYKFSDITYNGKINSKGAAALARLLRDVQRKRINVKCEPKSALLLAACGAQCGIQGDLQMENVHQYKELVLDWRSLRWNLADWRLAVTIDE